MKKLLLFLILTSALAFGQINGTFTVGSGGTYDSLGAAIAALNAGGVDGAVTMLLLNGTHNVGSNISLGCTGTSVTNTITFKPDAGATVTVNFLDGSSTASIDGHFVIGSPNALSTNLVSTNYVTIDGSNNGTSSKDLTINGPVTTLQRSVIRIFGNSDNITIKNCIININTTSASSNAPINITNFFSTPTNFNPDNIAIQNNTLNGTTGTASVGIHSANSGAPTVGATNLIISGNIISGNLRGCFISYTNDANIYGNTITVASTGATTNLTAYGITVQTNFSTAGVFNIYNNKLTSLTTNCTIAGASNGVIGIDNQTTASHPVNIYNNFIGGFGFTGSPNNARVYGIRVTSTSICNVYHNTIYIPELTDMATSNNIAGIAFATAATTELTPSASANTTIKNNIIKIDETTMKVWGIRRVGMAAATFVSNYNDVFINASNTSGNYGFYNATDRQTMQDWRDSSLQDANSKNVDVTLTSASDLHLAGGSNGDVNLIGVTGLGIGADIDGDTRSGTFPYMGADEASTPLPVELTSFTAVARGKNVELNWKTATETNNMGFDVEKSVNGVWSKIGFVNGAGTSNAPKEYGYVDAVSENGTYSYRLKQIDRDGKFTYNAAIEVNVNAVVSGYELAQNFPNPFNPTTTIRFSVKQLGQTSVKVYDITGREVATLFNNVASPGQVYNVQFNATGLSSGVYFYVLQSQNFREVKKMSLLK
ncbi:MAG: T9SS type A sorting domain-containing protein [Bacteroidota bacterium]|nr:T9SS type A sorting domain-containing protein [Bacteroidota bacterium]